MKLAFVVHRANFLKHYGPVIDAALRRGWEVECWLEDRDQGAKEYLRIRPEMIRNIWEEVVTIRSFRDRSEIQGLIRQGKIEAVVSLYPRDFYFSEQSVARFICLQDNTDTFSINSHVSLSSSDFVCLYSPFWWDYVEQFYREENGISKAQLEDSLKPKIAFTGFTQLDALKNINPIDVRKKLDLPPDQNVVLVMPIDLQGWPGAWPKFFASSGFNQWVQLLKLSKDHQFFKAYWHWVVRGVNDKRLAESLKRFSQNNDAILLAKLRGKDPLRNTWHAQVDKSLYDKSFYPPPNLEAIAIADLCIFFYSTAVQEAAHAGVPSLCIDRPNRDLVKHKLWRVGTECGPYNFPGVVTWKTMTSVVEDLPDERLSDFRLDRKAQRKYAEFYNGPVDHRSSERVLDLLL